MSRTRNRLPLLAALLAAMALSAGCNDDNDLLEPPPPPGNIELTFIKSGGDGGVWTGTVSGDFEGVLTTELLEAEEDEAEEGLFHVHFLWIIDAGANSFTGDLSGTVHFGTGVAEMQGEVIDAADPELLGLAVEEEGQLVDHDPETEETTFQGTIAVIR